MTSEQFADFKKVLAERLKSLGYEAAESDEFVLKFITEKVESHIKNQTNLDAVPEGLHHVFVDMVCGELLYEKKNSNLLTDEQIEAVVASISEGDTTVSFDTKTSPQALFEALTDSLMNEGNKEFIRYRKLVW